MQPFRDLKVWQRAHGLALNIYKMTQMFSPEAQADERFGLISQVRRAAVSVPTNIAEGSKRKSRADYAHFVNIAEGSASEVGYLLLLSRDLGYAEPDVVEVLSRETDEIGAMLYRFRIKLEEPG